MNENASSNGKDEIRANLEKKPYHEPKMREFGKLHLLTQGSGGTVGDAGAQFMVMSDRALKENIVRIGDHPLGIGVYLFDYKAECRGRYGHGRQFGVMADEVETVLPEAVHMRRDGYKMVDYAMLGLRPTVR